MIQQLNQLILPSTLMQSFDAYREEAVRRVSRPFNEPQLAWFLDMMNRFRGPEDRKECLLDVFDPSMFTDCHSAWEDAPGTRIEMPALTSDIAKAAGPNSEFADIALDEILELRNCAETYADDELLGLARIAAAALVDQGATFHGREAAIRYLALNASAALEDLWATDDTLWRAAPARVIEFDDMVAKRKAALLDAAFIPTSFQEKDFACYSKDEIRLFAFDIRGLFLMDRAKHLAICTRCQGELESWTRLVNQFERDAVAHDGRANA
jgi:hypothetical protein